MCELGIQDITRSHQALPIKGNVMCLRKLGSVYGFLLRDTVTGLPDKIVLPQIESISLISNEIHVT